MVDLPPDPQTRGGIDGAGSRTPRWVKVFLILVFAIMLLLGIMKLAGGAGDHGPGRHTGQSQGQGRH